MNWTVEVVATTDLKVEKGKFTLKKYEAKALNFLQDLPVVKQFKSLVCESLFLKHHAAQKHFKTWTTHFPNLLTLLYPQLFRKYLKYRFQVFGRNLDSDRTVWEYLIRQQIGICSVGLINVSAANITIMGCSLCLHFISYSKNTSHLCTTCMRKYGNMHRRTQWE